MPDGRWIDEGAELTNTPDPAAAELTAAVIRVGRMTEQQSYTALREHTRAEILDAYDVPDTTAPTSPGALT